MFEYSGTGVILQKEESFTIIREDSREDESDERFAAILGEKVKRCSGPASELIMGLSSAASVLQELDGSRDYVPNSKSHDSIDKYSIFRFSLNSEFDQMLIKFTLGLIKFDKIISEPLFYTISRSVPFDLALTGFGWPLNKFAPELKFCSGNFN